ncbi:hypothetical protein EVAR_94756_1 [Eumeta japonica]|uniref:Secreted protein n=1 Tax=Eumeta variegata TaxID=151549 RepID=A0A4C1UVW1_EUMVA|nr:hypothetical protein EVAR_94756_1 [Eumeta japonica]
MRRFNTPHAFLLLSRVLILHHCDAFVTIFTAAEFRALYCTALTPSFAKRPVRHGDAVELEPLRQLTIALCSLGRIFPMQFECKQSAVSSAKSATWTSVDSCGISFTYAECSSGEREALRYPSSDRSH